MLTKDSRAGDKMI